MKTDPSSSWRQTEGKKAAKEIQLLLFIVASNPANLPPNSLRPLIFGAVGVHVYDRPSTAFTVPPKSRRKRALVHTPTHGGTCHPHHEQHEGKLRLPAGVEPELRQVRGDGGRGVLPVRLLCRQATCGCGGGLRGRTASPGGPGQHSRRRG